MAEVAVNGTHAPHQAYAGMDAPNQFNHGAYGQNGAAPPQASNPPASSSTPAPAAPASQPEIPKDEVGWYFVEQYYTTLSRSPEKLYLFYNKRSQFVSGQETDKVPVCVGQRAINDKIKELDFQDCKVRVTNVDSQASDSNIVIQVIGEISNKSQPHKKFTQTFVLATQTNGYFVLNDIFRYIVDEEDDVEAEAAQPVEEVQEAPADAEAELPEPVPSAAASEPKGLSDSADPAAVEKDAQVIHDEIVEIVKKAVDPEAKGRSVASVAVNGTATEEETPVVVEPEQPAAVVDTPKVEKPATPEPTPAQSPPKQASTQAAAPPKPALPKTWASLAASANKVATPAAPAAPAQPASQARAPTGPTPPTKPQGAQPATAPAPVAPAAQRDDSPAAGQQDEWTAVGGSHNRQQSRQVAQPEVPQNRAYIKNVFEGVDAKELRSHLEKFGELTYLDVSRAKNCAFVDFKTAEGYNAAVAANPHEISGERLFVEERKTRPGQAPFAPNQRGQFQGPRGGRGGANQGPQRGAFQGGRGGNSFPARGGRGGTSSPRGGRGGTQAA